LWYEAGRQSFPLVFAALENGFFNEKNCFFWIRMKKPTRPFGLSQPILQADHGVEVKHVARPVESCEGLAARPYGPAACRLPVYKMNS
jgi:hypothetical protein